MKITEMTIPNAFRLAPDHLPDRRGSFYEGWRLGELVAAVGRQFPVGQVNYSVSRRNTLRGIHGITLPPGQAKLVTCVRGRVLDVVVDLRVGSPTFGVFETTVQDEESGLAVFLAEGLGHAFLALTDDVCMSYVCSSEYVHGSMIDIQALDPRLDIPWNLTEPPIMSDKDIAAPGIDEAAATGLLPSYAECQALYAAAALRGQR
jgi:NDP-hexose 3,5-(Or5-) epimerase